MLWRGSFDALLLFDDRRTFDLIPPRFHAAFVARWTKLLRHGAVAGSISLRADGGSEIPVDYRGAANVLPAVHLFLWVPSRSSIWS